MTAKPLDSNKRIKNSEKAYKQACNRTCENCKRKAATYKYIDPMFPEQTIKMCKYCGHYYIIYNT